MRSSQSDHTASRRRAFVIYELVFRMEDGVPVPEIGGIQRYLYELTRILSDEGLDVYVIQRGDKNLQEYRCQGCTVVTVTGSAGSSFGKVVRRVIRHYNIDLDADLILWGTDVISTPVTARRTIAIQHGVACDFTSPQRGMRAIGLRLGLKAAYKLMQRRRALRSFNNAQHRVCVDHNFVNWHQTFAYDNFSESNRIHVIPNFARPASEERTLRLKTGEPIRVLFARRFVEKRGVIPMVHAARKIAALHPNAIFHFAGDGPLRPLVERLRSDIGEQRVEIGPYHPAETDSIHQAAQIAVIPTIGSEGTSLSLLEAMANGCCVIATPVGGMSNIVLDGHNGLLVRPSATEICDAVSRIIGSDDLANKLSRNAIHTVRDAFSFDRWQQSWRSVIREALI